MPMPTVPEATTATVQVSTVSGDEPVVPLDEGEEEIVDEGGGVLEEDAAPAPKAKKKKKSSAPLIAAAGLGALLLLR